jgi:CheY-like chemotaxis protein
MNKYQPKILVVDDDPEILEMYGEILYIEGVEMLKAHSAENALELCKNHQNIQVILSDSNMGKMSGMELLKNLGSSYETIPVFYLLTGSYEISDEDVKKEGGSGLILKPFDLDEILERIKKDIKF